MICILQGKVKSMAIKLISTAGIILKVLLEHLSNICAGTGFFYVTNKNPRNVAHKLSLMKVLLTLCLAGVLI